MNKFGSKSIKTILVIVGVLIAIFILFATQMLVNRIQKRETQIAKLYAKSLEYIANDTSGSGEYSFIFNEILTQIDFPIIATNGNDDRVEFHKNIEIDSTLPKTEIQSRLLNLAKEMREINLPIKVIYRDSIVIYHLNYGQSSLITQLKLFPFIELAIGGLFVIFGYVAFSYIKKNEQSNLWVGLSKETAHQLGTPLTSLLGWLAILRETSPGDPMYREILDDIEKDLDRLKKISTRFSKIGSEPTLQSENLCNIINEVYKYLERRIPSLISADGKVSKKIDVKVKCSKDIHARVNKELFEWVLENLLKNAIDAIDKPVGTIEINVEERGKEIILDVKDTGKGIDKKYKKDIFRPGFSTKKRGWGLGLSLAKRIIDDYHKGKLILYDSVIEQGSIFRIKLSK